MRHFQKDVDKIQRKVIEALNKTKLFSCIDETVLGTLLKDALYSLKALSAAEELSVENSLVLVISGELEAYKNEGGKRIFLKKITCGEITGIATLFDKTGQYISTLVTKKPSEVIWLSENFVTAALRSSPDFAERFSRVLCEKLRYLNSRIDTYTQPSVEDKLLEFIRAGASGDGKYPFIEMSMLSLSSALGVGRASLYRALTSLESTGEIKKEGKKIYLLK